jgi:uncharacterized protein YicC (UPF0701 family)
LTEDYVKEYRDEAMKHLEAAERGEAQESAVEVNAAIASSLIAIAETLHAIQVHVEKLTA